MISMDELLERHKTMAARLELFESKCGYLFCGAEGEELLEEALGLLQQSVEAEETYPAGKMGGPGGATKKVDDSIEVDAEDPDEAE